jgi:hypothetical protein
VTLPPEPGVSSLPFLSLEGVPSSPDGSSSFPNAPVSLRAAGL